MMKRRSDEKQIQPANRRRTLTLFVLPWRGYSIHSSLLSACVEWYHASSRMGGTRLWMDGIWRRAGRAGRVVRQHTAGNCRNPVTDKPLQMGSDSCGVLDFVWLANFNHHRVFGW